jgi:arylsulfatase
MNRSHSITADVDIPQGGAEGVLLSHGGNDGGYSLYLQNGKLCYVHNYVAAEYFKIESIEPVPPGRHKLRYEFEAQGQPDINKGKGAPGIGQLYIDGKLVGQVEMPVTTPIALGLTSSVTCGADPGAPVTPDYRSPFKFTGKIYNVIVDVSGDLIRDTEAEMAAIMAKQ